LPVGEVAGAEHLAAEADPGNVRVERCKDLFTQMLRRARETDAARRDVDLIAEATGNVEHSDTAQTDELLDEATGRHHLSQERVVSIGKVRRDVDDLIEAAQVRRIFVLETDEGFGPTGEHQRRVEGQVERAQILIAVLREQERDRR